MHAGNLVVATGLAQPKEIAMPYSCKVAGTLEVSPTKPVLHLKISGPKVVSIEVRSTQPGFEVHGARVIEGPFSASVDGRISENAFACRSKCSKTASPRESEAIGQAGHPEQRSN